MSHSPLASSMPRLRAWFSPCLISITRRSGSGKSRSSSTTAPVPSVELLSTTRTSPVHPSGTESAATVSSVMRSSSTRL
jgi:hypothetical protein